MKSWSVYDAATGLFTGEVVSVSDGNHDANLFGRAAVEGRFDRLSQRVDISTGAIIDYQPPRPDHDHEWQQNVVNGRPRWVKKTAVAERDARVAAALREIDSLERSQLRAIRELVINPSDREAMARLERIDAEIAAKRRQLV